MKDELSRKIKTKFVKLISKTFSYLIDDGSDDKKANDTKNCVIKKKLIKNLLENKAENRIKKKQNRKKTQKRFKFIQIALKLIIKNS